jgi:hypothetical protein
MTGDSTIVSGIEIPSSDPVFLAVVIGIHIPLGWRAWCSVPSR